VTRTKRRGVRAALLRGALLAGTLLALRASMAQVADRDASIPAPQDRDDPGVIALHVDLTDARRRIFHVRESIPAHAGPLVLLYPMWIPGEHGPSGTLDAVAGLKLSAGGNALAWRRDLVEPAALHVAVPAGVTHIELEFQLLSPTGNEQNFGQSVSATQNIVDLEWNQVLFYPAGYYARRVRFDPQVQVPSGWQLATALERTGSDGAVTRFERVDLETLIDSPLITGENFRRVPLTAAGAAAPVWLDMVADRAANLEASAAQIQQQVALVQQAAMLFESHHYRHYDFLLTLSDTTGHFGLEHHESSDDRTHAENFTDPATYRLEADLMPHEYVHSWNGKFRRPAGLIVRNFNEPMKDDLLWVYEGLTNYYGTVLAARSGAWTADDLRQYLAVVGSALDHVPGRTWRPLQDTADEAAVLFNISNAWLSWRRRTDFYAEGTLIWLDVDTKLRELSHDSHSLDDFARAFYGMQDGSAGVLAYRFEDVVAALNRIERFDWASLLTERLNSHDPHAPLDGITRGGWRLVYRDTPDQFFVDREKVRKIVDLTASLGIVLSNSAAAGPAGELADVLWDGPAFAAGLAPGMTLIAVNGQRYTPEVLKEAIRTATHSREPIELLMRNADVYWTARVDDHQGLKYPHLERIEGTPDRLGAIARAR
jgi:predicted metalloprotease with PDZ domain